MLYSFSCLFPKGKSITEQTKHILKLRSGIINKIEVMFPEGCCGLVQVYINDGLFQIAPVNTDDTFAGSGVTIKFNEDREFITEPYELQLYGWNEDTENNHTIAVMIEIQDPSSLLRYVMKNLSNILTFKTWGV